MSKAKYIETPEDLWKLFEQYKEETKSTPFLEHDFVGGIAKEVNRKHERPLSVMGFKRFGHYKEVTVRHYLDNTDKAYEEYRHVCSRIVEEIKADQIDGGMAGIYNPSITQRLNNLVEKIQEDGTKEITIKVIRGDRNKAE